MKILKRIYHHYKKWEDFLNGFYSLNEIDNFEENYLIKKCAELLKNADDFYNVMLEVINNWRKSTEVNLTNINRNRQAWLGQASCCYKYNAPEYITKLAWRLLTKEEQNEANRIADIIIHKWDSNCFNNQRRLF